jgi:hypothetical protein
MFNFQVKALEHDGVAKWKNSDPTADHWVEAVDSETWEKYSFTCKNGKLSAAGWLATFRTFDWPRCEGYSRNFERNFTRI